ncbi:hypothetical protein [Altererythrobacter sp.]|uniref:hypothetical protein n=1 Tax=Altererythrobacter sp. TaxID=1872480 RepID=UPI001B10282F|nr:hypothetical protein [Altererythrobacter sp.]MBO6945534.1 hypothetical protein [Altererythrobacter sp.]
MAGFLDIFPEIGRLTFGALLRPKVLTNGNAISSFKYVLTVRDEQPVGADGVPRYVTPRQQAILGYALLPFALFPVTFLLIFTSANGAIDLNELSYELTVLVWLGCQFAMATIFIPWANSCLEEIRNQRYLEAEERD